MCHGVGIGVWVGVHAYAVDAYGLYPPDAVLDEVFYDVRVALVEVGHGGHEPSVYGLSEVYLAGVWVDDGCELVACLEVFVVDLGIAVHGLQCHGLGLVLGQ